MTKKQKPLQRKKTRAVKRPIDQYEEAVEERDEDVYYEKEDKNRSNIFYIAIIIILFLLLAVGVVFLIRFYTFDRVNVHHTGIPSTNGDEGFEVLGSSTVSAIPDVAIVNFSVEKRSENIRDAQSENTTISNTLVSMLRKEGVDEEDIEVLTYNINPQYRFDDDGNRVLDGFEAVQRFEAKIRAINNTGEILNALIENGATNISDLRFTVDDIEKLEDEALINAISDARVLAETSVAATGHGLGRVVSIQEVDDTLTNIGRVQAYSAEALQVEGDVPEIYTGKQEITKVVKVQFALN